MEKVCDRFYLCDFQITCRDCIGVPVCVSQSGDELYDHLMVFNLGMDIRYRVMDDIAEHKFASMAGFIAVDV